MSTRTKNSTEDALDDPFQPDLGSDIGPSIEQSTPDEDLEIDDAGIPDIEPGEENSGIAESLSSIERDGVISMEAARNGGLAVLAGSTGYINFVHRDIADAVKEAFPNSSIDNYVLEELGDINFPSIDTPDYSSIDDVLPEYSSVKESFPFDVDGVTDEVVGHLNKEITEPTQFEGVESAEGPVDVARQISTDNFPDIFLTSFDQLAHGVISGTGANLMSATVDRFTEGYDPKKIAVGGMSTALAFALVKEGIYEGGPGMQFNLESTDVQGDFVMDTLGAAYGTYSYHKNKTASEKTEPGIAGKAARKAGRGYGRTEHMINSVLSGQEPSSTELFEEPGILEEELSDSDMVLVTYEVNEDSGNITADINNIEVYSEEPYKNALEEFYMPDQLLEDDPADPGQDAEKTYESQEIEEEYNGETASYETPGDEIKAGADMESLLEPSANQQATATP